MSLTQERLKTLMSYDPETGIFTRLTTRGGYWAGSKVGTNSGYGYTLICIDKKRYWAHRLAWLYVHGKWPERDIDHINGVGTDNRIANLREATRSQNISNRGLLKSNTSGFKGVHWNSMSEKYQARAEIRGRYVYLGVFEDIKRAAAAYDIAVTNAYGEFAVTNKSLGLL